MLNIEPDLNLSLLHEIADGSNEFIIESIDMFLTNTPELLDAISKAVSDRDWVAAHTSAHILKSNLGFFGMPLSQALMQEIELMTKESAPDPILASSRFNEVNELIAVNLKALAKIKAELEVGS